MNGDGNLNQPSISEKLNSLIEQKRSEAKKILLGSFVTSDDLQFELQPNTITQYARAIGSLLKDLENEIQQGNIPNSDFNPTSIKLLNDAARNAKSLAEKASQTKKDEDTSRLRNQKAFNLLTDKTHSKI